MIIAAIEAKITNLEADISKERAIINAAITDHQIGAGYWQRRHSLECQLRVVHAIREAICEARP